MIQFFQKGGPIMWPLLILSLAVLTVAIERSLFLVKESLKRDNQSFDKIFRFLNDGRAEKALEVSMGSKDQSVRVIGYGIKNIDSSFETAISHAAEKELDRYSAGLSVLDTAITLAPLLGLLGTVTGMISAFGLLGASELEAPAAITGGIAEALIATAFGLGIAITALLPFNLIQNSRERRARLIEDRATKIQLILGRKSASANNSSMVA
jgi:biopolymer transport protein ExbB